jgi:hypothetical protein
VVSVLQLDRRVGENDIEAFFPASWFTVDLKELKFAAERFYIRAVEIIADYYQRLAVT